MSDERFEDDFARDEHDERDDERRNRLRIILAAVLILLMILLAVLGAFIVRVLTPTGQPADNEVSTGLTWVRSIYGFGPAEDQQFYRPTDVAIGPDGTIWGTDPQRARILGFNPDGTYDTLIHQGPAGSGPGRLYSPEGIDVSEDNEIYVADFGDNKIIVFSPENEVLREWEVPLPVEVAVQGDRVAAATVNGVAVFDTSGELLNLIGTRGTGEDQFEIPHGIAFTEDGNIVVSDTHNQRLKAYTQEGDLLWTSTGGGDVPEDGESLYQLPSGLTIDGNGRLVFVDPFEFSVVVTDAEGSFLERYGEFGQSDGLFVYPTGIDYDPARDWFVIADTSNDRLQVVRIDGSGGGVMAAATRAASSPYRVCCIPLILLLIAILIIVVRRRRQETSSSAESWEDAGISED